MIHLRRILVVLTAALAAWAVIIAVADGVFVEVGEVRFSSRNPINPAIAALLLAILTVVVSRRLGGLRTIPEDWGGQAYVWPKTVVGPGIDRSAVSLLRQGALMAPIVLALAAGALDIARWRIPTPLWLDEQMIAINIRDRGFAELPGVLWLGQSAPLGWLVLQRLVLLTFGPGEVALRLIPMLFGLGTIGLAVAIGRRWLTAVGASALVLLCAFGMWLTHYMFEIKHYTADVFWALLLPALAIRAVEGPDSTARMRRSAIWWIAAAVGLWLSNGALFVTPGVAVGLCLLMWRRDGIRAALTVASLGVAWLVSFAVYFRISIAPILRDGYLHRYWNEELPGADLTVPEVVHWIAGRFDDLAVNPAGSEWGIVLWLVALAGCLLGSHRGLGTILLTAPLTMFLLAGLGMVPLYQRFALWIVPAIYTGIALGLDRLWRAAAPTLRTRAWWRLAAIGAVGAVPVIVTAGIVRDGYRDLTASRPRDEKQGLDDRSSVRWLVGERRTGDAIATTRLGWPAIWWYGGYSIAGNRRGGAPGSFRLEFERSTERCDSATLSTPLADYRRLLVYRGFPDVSEGFDRLLLEQLSAVGTIVELETMSARSRVAIVELGTPRPSPVDPKVVAAWSDDGRARLEGCLTLRPAARW